MLKSQFEWAIWIVLAALLGGGWIVASQERVSQTQSFTLSEAPVVGHLAPDFTLTDTVGQSYHLNSLLGQPVILNFWATWCAPCRLEMPAFQNVSRKYNGRFTLLGINQGETASQINDFALSLGLSYPLLVDESNNVNRVYLVNSLPTTIFIDAEGVVQEVLIGALSQAVLEERLERLLQP